MVEASDQALPTPKTSTAQVVVTVPRDTRPPYFELDSYVANITEDKPRNSHILDIKARDDNQKV